MRLGEVEPLAQVKDLFDGWVERVDEIAGEGRWVSSGMCCRG